jgi:hypothetical protein
MLLRIIGSAVRVAVDTPDSLPTYVRAALGRCTTPHLYQTSGNRARPEQFAKKLIVIFHLRGLAPKDTCALQAKSLTEY